MTQFPNETHSGNNNRTKVDAQPEAGTRQMAGKTNECDSVIKDAKKYTPSAVTIVDPDANKGACLAAGKKQRVGTYDQAEDSNPKHQPASFKE